MHEAAEEQAMNPEKILAALDAAGVIDIGRLAGVCTTGDGCEDEVSALRRRAAWSQLGRLDGRSIAQLTDSEHTLAAKSLQVLLGLAKPPPLSGSTGGDEAQQAILYERGQSAMARLEGLRLGQPDPELMYALSPAAREAMDYLRTRFRQRRPVIRLVAGEMGDGKTTLARGIQLLALEEEATPVLLTMARSQGFDPAGWLRDIVLDHDLLSTAFREIAETALVLGSEREKALSNCWRTSPLSLVMTRVVQLLVSQPAQYVTAEGARVLARECESALTPWISSSYSRVTPGREFLSRHGGEGLFTGHFDAKRMVPSILAEFLCFYREAGCFPVWLLDEFESVAGLSSQRQQIALGFFRDAIDLISANHGAMFLFSTGDGRSAIRSYPALDDRLKAPADLSALYSPTWFASDYSRWSAGDMIEALLALYEAAAHTGDNVSLGVIDHATDIRRLSDEPTFQNWVEGDGAVPRERLKGIIALLDQVRTDGMEHFDSLLIREEEAEFERSQLQALEVLMEAELDSDWEVDACRDAELDNLDIADEDLQLSSNDPLARALPSLEVSLPEREADHTPSPILVASAEPSLEEEVSKEEALAGFVDWEACDPCSQPDIATPCSAPAELSIEDKARLSEFGILRWKRRAQLDAAELPFHHSAWTYVTTLNELKELVPKSSNCAFLGDRLATIRDIGQSVQELWPAFVTKGELRLNKRESIVLCSGCNKDQQRLQSAADGFLAMVDRHNGVVPVAKPETKEQLNQRKKLEIEDREAIRKMKEATCHPWPFMRDKPRWPGCRAPGEIRPLENVRIFRHALYTWIALTAGLVPRDEWIDRFVLDALYERYGYRPRSSRDGVQFIVPRGGFLSRFDKRRFISTESVTDAVARLQG